MSKRSRLVLLLMAALVFCAFTINASAYDARYPYPTESLRTWMYFNFNVALTPEVSLHIMPGQTVEYKKWDEDGHKNPTNAKVGSAGEYSFGELFIGPWYSMKIDNNLSLKVGLEYYLMQFEVDKAAGATTPALYDRYFYNHCIEIIPVLTYTISPELYVSNRIILHNIVNSTMMDNSTMNGLKKDEMGFSTTLREMLVVGYKVTPKITLLLQDEIFVSLIKNSDTSYTTSGMSFDYKTGFYQNRFYVGATFSICPEASITAYYLLRHDFALIDSPEGSGSLKGDYYKKGDCTAVSNYLLLMFNYNIK
jgi:hypothetical protein